MRIATAASICMMIMGGSVSCSPSGTGNAPSGAGWNDTGRNATNTTNATNAAAGEGRSDAAGASAGAAGTPAGTGPARAGQPAVILEPPGHPPAEVTVEVASTPRQIQRGLMYREHMPPDHGMLFLMREERVHSFWMHNTLIPLDMIFIGRDMTVAGVVARAEPLTDTSRRVNARSYYVLEVNGGWAAAHHVEAGTPVRFRDVQE
jgi:uncharacterized membrane protein (UPF0127 family)